MESQNCMFGDNIIIDIYQKVEYSLFFIGPIEWCQNLVCYIKYQQTNRQTFF